ncbi:hypothetical protein EBT16_12085, partial [bacterium]|nr:hypothetical protein [bacterium]
MSVPFYDPSLLAPLSMDGSLSIIKKLLETNKPLDEENVEFLETSLAKIHSADFCLAVGSGTDALTIALRALELPPGTGVAVPGFSFVASASCILENQLIPFFVDVSPHTALCNPHHFFPLIEKAQVGAIIVPHLFGQIVELQELYLRAKRKNIYLIEDA